jgi:hypothetical protein
MKWTIGVATTTSPMAPSAARIQWVTATAVLVVMPALLAQTVNPSARQLLNVERTLTTIEIAAVLGASRRALTSKTFRVSSAPRGRGPEVLMGPGGRPKTVRTTYGIEGGFVGGTPGTASSTERRWREDIVSIVDYTGRPARRCDGSAEQGEMVIEYERRGTTNGWAATARRRADRDLGPPGLAPVLEMLRGAAPLTSGERRQMGDRRARAFVSPWTAPPPDPRSQAPLLTGDPLPNVAGDPVANDATQALWIDTASLLPLRWEVSRQGRVTSGFDIAYESMNLRPPVGVDAPACIR